MPHNHQGNHTHTNLHNIHTSDHHHRSLEPYAWLPSCSRSGSSTLNTYERPFGEVVLVGIVDGFFTHFRASKLRRLDSSLKNSDVPLGSIRLPLLSKIMPEPPGFSLFCSLLSSRTLNSWNVCTSGMPTISFHLYPVCRHRVDIHTMLRQSQNDL